MPVEFRMPKLGLTMEQGTIIKWLVDDGDAVDEGTAVLVVETDKVETDIESPASGRLHRVGDVGSTYLCGELVGYLLADGETPPSKPAPIAAPVATAPSTNGSHAVAPAAAVVAVGGRLLASPNARRVAAERGVDLQQVRGTGPGGRIVSEDVEAFTPIARPAPAPTRAPGLSVPATLAARTLADLLGVDLAAVPASARDGRVTREDVAAYVRGLLAASRPRSAVAAPIQPPTEIVPFTGMRGTIATRMQDSLREMAQLTLTMDADMDAVVADREARRERTAGRLPGFTDYVVAAAARALRAHPIVNSQVVDGGIALLPGIHVGVAVAADKGLFVPVVRDTDRLGIEALAAETFRLAEAARAGRLQLADLEGATFSVSALGMFDVDAFTPVINPPNAAILGVGRLRDDVAWDGDTPRRVRRLTLSLTWDHRVLDGAPAAAFCRTIVEHLLNPTTLG